MRLSGDVVFAIGAQLMAWISSAKWARHFLGLRSACKCPRWGRLVAE